MKQEINKQNHAIAIMKSIQQFFLFVVCMTAVSKSYARTGFTGNDMSEAVTDIPPFAPEMDKCREACQQKVHTYDTHVLMNIPIVKFDYAIQVVV